MFGRFKLEKSLHQVFASDQRAPVQAGQQFLKRHVFSNSGFVRKT